MTEPTPAPAEPVRTAGILGALTAAAVTAVVGAIATARAGNWTGLGQAVGIAVTAVATLIAFALPLAAALWARARVTPLARPRTADGSPAVLLTEGTYAELRRRGPGPQTPGVADHAQ
jgi:hypothetical protein